MPSTDYVASFGSLVGTAWSMVGQPLYYLLGVFSNLVYSTFLGVYNDPSSWKTTLLPPLATLLAMYFAVRMVSSTVRSSARMAWFAIKWSVLLFAALAVYSILAGEGEIATSPGVAPTRGWRSPFGPSGTGQFVPVSGSRADAAQRKDEHTEQARALLVTVGTQAVGLVRALPLDIQATIATMVLATTRFITEHLGTSVAQTASKPQAKRSEQPRFGSGTKASGRHDQDQERDSAGLLGLLGLNTHDLFLSDTWQPVEEWLRESLDPERNEKRQTKDRKGHTSSKKKSTRRSPI